MTSILLAAAKILEDEFIIPTDSTDGQKQLSALFSAGTWGRVEKDIQHALAILKAFPSLAKEHFPSTVTRLFLHDLENDDTVDNAHEPLLDLPPIFHFARAALVDVPTIRTVHDMCPDLLDITPGQTPLDHACYFQLSFEVVEYLVPIFYQKAVCRSRDLHSPLQMYLEGVKCHRRKAGSVKTVDLLWNCLSQHQDHYQFYEKILLMVVPKASGSNPLLQLILAKIEEEDFWDKYMLTMDPFWWELDKSEGIKTIFSRMKFAWLDLSDMSGEGLKMDYLLHLLKVHARSLQKLGLILPNDPKGATLIEGFLCNPPISVPSIAFGGQHVRTADTEKVYLDAISRGVKENDDIRTIDLGNFSQLNPAHLSAIVTSGLKNLDLMACTVNTQVVHQDLGHKDTWSYSPLETLAVSITGKESLDLYSSFVSCLPHLRVLIVDATNTEDSITKSAVNEWIQSTLDQNQFQICLAINGDTLDLPRFCLQLKNANCLCELQIDFKEPQASIEGLMVLAETLENNSTPFIGFRWRCNGSGNGFYGFNCEVEGLPAEVQVLLEKIQYYSLLNLAGRQGVGTTTKDSCKPLIAAFDRVKFKASTSFYWAKYVDSLYYGLLREMPSNWANSRAAAEDAKGKKRKRTD